MSLFKQLIALFCMMVVVYSVPIGPERETYGFNEIDNADAPYLMNLLKRTALFLPAGNQDQMIKAILKSRRY